MSDKHPKVSLRLKYMTFVMILHNPRFHGQITEDQTQELDVEIRWEGRTILPNHLLLWKLNFEEEQLRYLEPKLEPVQY